MGRYSYYCCVWYYSSCLRCPTMVEYHDNQPRFLRRTRTVNHEVCLCGSYLYLQSTSTQHTKAYFYNTLRSHCRIRVPCSVVRGAMGVGGARCAMPMPDAGGARIRHQFDWSKLTVPNMNKKRTGDTGQKTVYITS